MLRRGGGGGVERKVGDGARGSCEAMREGEV